MRRRTSLAVVALLVAGCTVGPDYKRPRLDVPKDFRGTSATTPESLGDLSWRNVFPDETLQSLIRTALEQNYDLQVAAARILDARAQVSVARSFQFPTVDGRAEAIYSSTAGDRPALTPRESFTPIGGLDFLFEIDLWGRFRRGTEAARADLLATQDNRLFVITTLVSDMASAYFQLRSLDEQLVISRNTLLSRQDSLRLVTLRFQGGVASQIDVRQAEILLATAAQTVPDTERQIEQTENVISILLGRNPDAVPRGRPLEQQIAVPAIPAGLPSALLERRPDVRQAEAQLAAATARIGVARADYFPRVLLTGSAAAGGIYTHPAQTNADNSDIRKWFGPLGFFSVGPTVTVPIFNMGRVAAGVNSAEARTETALVQYRQVVLGAFRDVADAIVEFRKRGEARIAQAALTVAARDTARLANIRYRGGVSSYLEVLDSERQLFDAELALVSARRDELLAVVRLYKALGGGWQL
ncbi:MAG TPA: efflux transporter outer membrane subunit [Methylomirabilota bacterium]|jgi:multidrug efflux system outer membrane protein